MSVIVKIPGKPFAQQRHRSRAVKLPSGQTIAQTYDTKKNRSWKAMARDFMAEQMAGKPLMQGGVCMYVGAYFICPKSLHRKRVPRPAEIHTKKPDLDNVVKAVKDAGNSVIWQDDSQVCLEVVWKIQQAQEVAPFVLVLVREITDLDVLEHPPGLITLRPTYSDEPEPEDHREREEGIGTHLPAGWIDKQGITDPTLFQREEGEK